MDIKNKVAIVTGGAGGIGFATVHALLKCGAKHVAIFDANESKNTTSLQELDKEFGVGHASVYTCDLSTPGKFHELFDTVVKSHKNVDILINCLGVVDDKRYVFTISVNLVSVIESTLYAIERMGKHNKGEGGVVVNVSSIAGLMPYSLFPVYSATKNGVVSFTTSLKDYYSKTGVRALVICPGSTTTPMAESISKLHEKTLNFVEKETAINKLSECYFQPPENVAEAVVKMIQQAKSGAVWVSEDNEPPYAIKDMPFYKERRISI